MMVSSQLAERSRGAPTHLAPLIGLANSLFRPELSVFGAAHDGENVVERTKRGDLCLHQETWHRDSRIEDVIELLS